MSSCFITVLNMSLTASYAVLAVIIVRLLLKRAPKIFSYALWAVVLFRLVCPLSFESTFSLIPNNHEIIPHDIIYSQNPAISTGVAIADKTINQSTQSALPPVNPAASVNPMGIALEIGATIWILGIIVLLAYGLISYYRLKRTLSAATLVGDNVYEADGIGTPFVLGLIKPRIYIPAILPGNELGYIIKHEETHIRRCDHIIKPAAFLALVIHWFNPLIWISYFLMVKDMEMSCDESVIKQFNQDIRASYSNSLLSFSLKQSGLLSPLAFGESSIKSRIKNVLNYKRPAFWVIIVAVIAVAGMGIGLAANPVGSVTYKNLNYGFSIVLPKDFANNVNIKQEGNVIYFTHKEIQQLYPDGIIGVVGRIEVYNKKETTKDQLKELADAYNLKYLGENDTYYFGWAHATDVQIPPDASDSVKENYRALEEEFDQVIKTFKIKGGSDQEIAEKKGNEVAYEIPEVFKDTNLGAELPFIAYESEHQLIFYNYMGIFIYDLDRAEILKALIPSDLQFYHNQATIVDYNIDEKIISIYRAGNQAEYFYAYDIDNDKLYQYPIDQLKVSQDRPEVTGRMDTKDWTAWNSWYTSELTGKTYYPFRSIAK